MSVNSEDALYGTSTKVIGPLHDINVKKAMGDGLYVSRQPKATILGTEIPLNEDIERWVNASMNRMKEYNPDWSREKIVRYGNCLKTLIKSFPEKSLGELEVTAEIDVETIERCIEIANSTYVSSADNTIFGAMNKIFEDALNECFDNTNKKFEHAKRNEADDDFAKIRGEYE